MITAVATVQPLTGIPTPDVITKVLIAMVRPIVGGGLAISDGPELTPENFEAELVKLVQKRPQFSGHGPRGVELVISWISPFAEGFPRTGSLHSIAKLEPADTQPMVQSIITAAQLLHAPFSFVDKSDGGFADRGRQHRIAYQEDKTGADRVMGLFRGFTGIPWRTVLGPASVDFFGENMIAQLPDDLATRIGDGYWLLTPCEHPDEWTAASYCDGERLIIETLGCDRFFDPETGAMPTVLPPLPDISPMPVRARVRDESGEFQWQSFNGYPEELLEAAS